MERVANLLQDDRRELFEAAANKMGVRPAIIEKDFWVCWVINRLFTDEYMSANLVFKGGTSLSKVYGLIHRFSEDIDLVLHPEILDFGSNLSKEWERKSSKRQRDKFRKEIKQKTFTFMQEVFVPKLDTLLSDKVSIATAEEYGEIIVNINYPASFELAAIRNEVKLEIGPLASMQPSEMKSIMPYAAQEFPGFFDNSKCPVKVITLGRTFWEKATIAHTLAFREKPVPPGYSRHYYDLYCMAGSSSIESWVKDLELLREVVEFKKQFYPQKTAGYDSAVPPTFKIIPPTDRLAQLEADYNTMKDMIFDSPPTWEKIIQSLKLLEDTVNRDASEHR